jgi:hypothetical protein
MVKKKKRGGEGKTDTAVPYIQLDTHAPAYTDNCRELGCTGPTALSAPATPSAAYYTPTTAKAGKRPAWAGAGRSGTTFAWTRNGTGASFIVKRRPEGRLRDGLNRKELVRERTILRIILIEMEDSGRSVL